MAAWAGCKLDRLPRGEGREFFLDILFHRISEMEMFRQLTAQVASLDNGIFVGLSTLP